MGGRVFTVPSRLFTVLILSLWYSLLELAGIMSRIARQRGLEELY